MCTTRRTPATPAASNRLRKLATACSKVTRPRGKRTQYVLYSVAAPRSAVTSPSRSAKSSGATSIPPSDLDGGWRVSVRTGCPSANSRSAMYLPVWLKAPVTTLNSRITSFILLAWPICHCEARNCLSLRGPQARSNLHLRGDRFATPALSEVEGLAITDGLSLRGLQARSNLLPTASLP